MSDEEITDALSDAAVLLLIRDIEAMTARITAEGIGEEDRVAAIVAASGLQYALWAADGSGSAEAWMVRVRDRNKGEAA